MNTELKIKTTLAIKLIKLTTGVSDEYLTKNIDLVEYVANHNTASRLTRKIKEVQA